MARVPFSCRGLKGTKLKIVSRAMNGLRRWKSRALRVPEDRFIGRAALSTSELNWLWKGCSQLELPWDFKADCCYARSYIMVDYIRNTGFEPRKHWVFSDRVFSRSGRPLLIPGQFVGSNRGWRYHVAPVVTARQDSGRITDFVIDPSCSDGPLATVDWLGAMHGSDFLNFSTDADVYFVDPSKGQVQRNADLNQVAADINMHWNVLRGSQ